jgi:DNA-binding CsgD family transcriptional regulator
MTASTARADEARALLTEQHLTPGQRRVVELVAEGLTLSAAGAQLGFSRQGAHKLWREARSRRTPRVYRTARAAELLARELLTDGPTPRRAEAGAIRDRAMQCLERATLTAKQRVALERLAEHGNIRRTARECGCSALTVAAALRKLPAKEGARDGET